MTEVEKPPVLAGRGGLWVGSDDLELHLGVEVGFRPQRKAHPGIVVADLDAVAERLVRHDRPVTWDDDFRKDAAPLHRGRPRQPSRVPATARLTPFRKRPRPFRQVVDRPGPRGLARGWTGGRASLPGRAAALRSEGRRRRRRARGAAAGAGAARGRGRRPGRLAAGHPRGRGAGHRRRGQLAAPRLRGGGPRRGLVRHRRHRRPGGQRRPWAGAEARRDLLRPQPTTRARATAWTPAVGRHAGVTVAVLGNREPRRSAPRCATRSSRGSATARAPRSHQPRPTPAWSWSAAVPATRS